MRIAAAAAQALKYANLYSETRLRLGNVDAFSGTFVINCNNISYSITYETPSPGVILYYVEQLESYETSPYAVKLLNNIPVSSAQRRVTFACAGLVLVSGGGGNFFDPTKSVFDAY